MKTVFISSTYQDLAEHRRAIWQILEQFEVDVRGMERFGARTAAPLETCVAEVEQAEVYVGVVAFRLGSIDPESGKSFTQVEYERAAQLKKAILIYLADETSARVRYADIEIDPQARERLAAFKATLRERHTIETFSTPEDLTEKINRDFARELTPKVSAPAVDEYDRTRALAARFMLLPRTVGGREVRVRVRLAGNAFPASRGLCKAFNLPYGSTVGAQAKIVAPDGDIQKFTELYAAGPTADRFLALAESQEPVDIYVRLQFSEQDIQRTRGEFFGYSFYYEDDPDHGEPNMHYVSAEGKAMLLFAKTAA